MIRYSITPSKLRKAIEDHSPGWLAKAEARTATFRTKGKYAEKSSIWSEVKPLYMRLQGDSKCAFCERQLEPVEYGKAEQDVEHFRPKGNVREWTVPKSLSDHGVKFAPVPNGAGGYYLLPYAIFNYAAACKPCNSALKSDHFPIAGKYKLNGDDPAKMRAERPYLLYPIGAIDDDPETIITFHGFSPQPAHRKKGHKRNRALVTIEFFKLDDVERKNLIRERVFLIVALFKYLEDAADATDIAAKQAAEELVEKLTESTVAHTNCARSFVRLFHADRNEARLVHEACEKVFLSIS